MNWIAKHPRAHPDMLGYVPLFILDEDPRPAADQIDDRYVGGWRPFKGFAMAEDGSLLYPGDPPTLLLFEAKLRDEVIRFYQHAWLAIIQPDGSYEISRID
jgi:hypothetical protein